MAKEKTKEENDNEISKKKKANKKDDKEFAPKDLKMLVKNVCQGMKQLMINQSAYFLSKTQL